MEILVEHGRGRGTGVYQRFLSIYTCEKNGLKWTHKIQLSGWHDFDAWAKEYIIERDESGKVVIRLEALRSE